MTDSKDEFEIESTNFEIDDAADTLDLIRDADRNVVNVAKTIIQLKKELANLQNNCAATKPNDLEVCRLQKKLTEMVVQYNKTIVDVLKLAKDNNFNIEDLECRKIDINQNTKLNDCVTTVIKSSEREQMVPWILINNEQNYPTFFHYDLNNNGTKCKETDNESFCSCNDESENCCSTDNKDNCTTINDNCCKISNNSDTDCKKEGVRDELMTIKGEINILHQQNRDFLCKLNSANQQTHILTNALKNKLENESGTCQPEQNGSKSKAQVLMLEINRLNDELKGLKRDRCQIELAKKVLNISDALCANCAGPINQCDGQKPQCKDLTSEYNTLSADYNNKLLEITNLRKKLSESQCTYKNYEDRIKILKTQVCQLQKQLFDFTSAKSHDAELACSNEKYLIESLRNRLQDATEEKTNMQMALDFHLTELEDKKSKFLAVLQTNQEQKFRIESICREKNKIAEEYEAEFNRMNDHLKSCLDELGTLPGLLATAQRDLEKETSKRLELEEERNNLLKEIESLNAILANDDREEKDKRINCLEEENTQLKAKIMTQDAILVENKRLYMERTHYSLQLKENLDLVRKEAALQVTKTKNFAECQMLKYAEYVKQLEQKLVEHRAIACLEFQKRDQIYERLRSQIELLTTNLNEAQKQIEHIINAKQSMEDKTGGEI
ncbi:ankyrin repeat domain-containing protein 36B, partial [Aphis craccivora]